MSYRTLLSFALLLQAAAEWVEISQQHYRKPARPQHQLVVEPTVPARPQHQLIVEPTVPARPQHQLIVEPTVAARPQHQLIVEPTVPARPSEDQTNVSITPQRGKGNVIRVATGIARVEHVLKPNVPETPTVSRIPDQKAAYGGEEVTFQKIKGGKPEDIVTERPSDKNERKSTRKPEDRIVTEQSNSRRTHSTSKPPEKVNSKSEKHGHNQHSTIKQISNKPNDNDTAGLRPKPKNEDSRPPEGVTAHTAVIRRQNNTSDPEKQASRPAATRRPIAFASKVPNRIYINYNKASSKIPGDDEYFFTETPNLTSTTEAAEKLIGNTAISVIKDGHEFTVKGNLPSSAENKKSYSTVTRRINSSVTKHSKNSVIKQRPFNYQGNRQTYVNDTIQSNTFQKADEISVTEPTIGPDDEPLNSEGLDIRRIDISSIVNPDIPDFITKQELSNFNDEGKHLYVEHEETTNSIPATPFLTTENDQISSTEVNEDIRHQDHMAGPTSGPKVNFDDDLIEEKKWNPLENVVKIMKVVSETIAKNTRRSISSKVRYLEDLRDTIMTNIERRIDEAWPEDGAAAAGRRPGPGRSTREARGHVDFPSSEGALMSISFLTFAVFLIKLIMQVIYKYKNETMMLTPTVFAVSRAADALTGRP